MRIERFWNREKQKQQQMEYYAWLNGYYNQYAIGTTMSKKIKYPKNPFEEEKVVVEDMELTEEEKIMWRNKVFGHLKQMSKKNQGE